MAVSFIVRLTPRAGRTSVDGVDDDGRLRVRVAAAPVDGAANEALIRLLATTLDVSRGSVTIESGATSRVKRIGIHGLDAAAIGGRWPGLALTP